MLQILNRDGSYIDSISEYSFDTWVFEDVNEIDIVGNPDQYLSKLVYLYDNDALVGSGIVENYKYNKNKNEGTLVVYPLVYDLRQDFISDETGKIVYYNDDLANVVESIITKYRAGVTNPVLYMKSKSLTGITVRYTFSYKTWLEGFNIIKKDFLRGDNFITIDPDGGVTVKNSVSSHVLNFGTDILRISYEKLADEIINYVEFDNGIPGDGHILKTYQDAASISAYGKRVAYVKDSRFKYVESADAYIASYLEKNAHPKIVVESVKTMDLSVKLYDKISIQNWEKTFDDDLSVVGLTYLKDGILELKVGTDPRRDEYTPEEQSDVSGDVLAEANAYTDDQIALIPDYTPPSYIYDTYIDSTEIRSPVIKGNTGYIYDKLMVGPSGIIVDGTNKNIRSSGYAPNSSGWKIDDAGNAEFNNATMRGNMKAGTININGQFTVDSLGNVVGNDFTNKTILFNKLGTTPAYQDGKMWCEGNPTNKVLWGYFGGDTTKQQISTSRMQASGSFDRTTSGTLSVSTWFQPRLIMFNGFFENTSQDVYGTTNGQAGSVSSSQGFCNAMSLDFRMVSGLVSNLNFTQSPSNERFMIDSNADNTYDMYRIGLPVSFSWTNNTLFITEYIKTVNAIDAIAADSPSKNCYAFVSSWADSGITISVVISSGWRLSGNFTIFG